jgi:hypothetical protein
VEIRPKLPGVSLATGPDIKVVRNTIPRILQRDPTQHLPRQAIRLLKIGQFLPVFLAVVHREKGLNYGDFSGKFKLVACHLSLGRTGAHHYSLALAFTATSNIFCN